MTAQQALRRRRKKQVHATRAAAARHEQAHKMGWIGAMHTRHGVTCGCLDRCAELGAALAQPRVGGELLLSERPYDLRYVLPLADLAQVSIEQLLRIIDAARVL